MFGIDKGRSECNFCLKKIRMYFSATSLRSFSSSWQVLSSACHSQWYCYYYEARPHRQHCILLVELIPSALLFVCANCFHFLLAIGSCYVSECDPTPAQANTLIQQQPKLLFNIVNFDMSSVRMTASSIQVHFHLYYIYSQEEC